MLTDSDYKNLCFDIGEAKAGTLPRSIPDMKVIESWWSCNRNDKDKLIRYIIYMYDKSSPLVKRYNNLDRRKQEAAHLAGYTQDDPSLKTYKDFQDQEFSDMVVDFLIYQNNYTWTMLVSNEQTFYEFQKTLLQESSMIRNDKDKINAIASKSKLMEESDKIVERINSYYKQVFVEDKLIETAKRVASSPEEMARIS
jgi:hypothetical protein